MQPGGGYDSRLFTSSVAVQKKYKHFIHLFLAASHRLNLNILKGCCLVALHQTPPMFLFEEFQLLPSNRRLQVRLDRLQRSFTPPPICQSVKSQFGFSVGQEYDGPESSKHCNLRKHIFTKLTTHVQHLGKNPAK